MLRSPQLLPVHQWRRDLERPTHSWKHTSGCGSQHGSGNARLSHDRLGLQALKELRSRGSWPLIVYYYCFLFQKHFQVSSERKEIMWLEMRGTSFFVRVSTSPRPSRSSEVKPVVG